MVDHKEQKISKAELPDVQQRREDNQTSSTRRRFVKGTALALPAIMTLRNGSAFAASTMCTEKDGYGESCWAGSLGLTEDPNAPLESKTAI